MEDNDDESPFNRRTAKRFDDNATPTEAPTIDWNMIRAQPLQNMSKFKDHPPVIKDFYNEHPEIAAMSREEVKAFRKENFDISVSFFVKETLSYVTAVVKNEEEEALKLKSPEELEDLVYEQIPKPVKTIEHAFRDYPEILEQCKKQNFLKPTPIQAQIWPILLKGLDCIGIAQTGTGKTLGFLLPALVHTDNQITPREQRVGPNVLVMSPTRELAIQIEQEVKKINYKGKILLPI
jgi:ATP-dependent RNA helicase DDX43